MCTRIDHCCTSFFFVVVVVVVFFPHVKLSRLVPTVKLLIFPIYGKIQIQLLQYPPTKFLFVITNVFTLHGTGSVIKNLFHLHYL